MAMPRENMARANQDQAFRNDEKFYALQFLVLNLERRLRSFVPFYMDAVKVIF
jgi:hypothetical protein